MNPSDRIVFEWLASSPSPAWPTYLAIARATGLNPRTVKRALKRLEAAGLVAWTTAASSGN